MSAGVVGERGVGGSAGEGRGCLVGGRGGVSWTTNSPFRVVEVGIA